MNGISWEVKIFLSSANLAKEVWMDVGRSASYMLYRIIYLYKAKST